MQDGRRKRRRRGAQQLLLPWRYLLLALIASPSAVLQSCSAQASTQRALLPDEQASEAARSQQQRATKAAAAIQRPAFGVPGIAVREHLLLTSSALPAGQYYKVTALVPAVDVSHVGTANVSAILAGINHSFDDHGACIDLARAVAEPMSPLYERKGGLPRPLPGGVPRAFYRWEGNVTRADLDAVPFTMRGPSCGHCTNFASYKIINGSLYRGPEQNAYPDMAIHRARTEDMLLVVLYMWDLPDMEFKLHFGDGCPTEAAGFSWNVCRHRPRGGFTMPSTTAWLSALGPLQTKVYHACLNHRYPAASRRPVAFWRGTNTDNNLVDRFTMQDYRQAARIRLHMDFGPTNETRIDAQLSALIFAEPGVMQAVGPLAHRLPMEDFNKAAVILDMDGNGWSDRWVKLVHYNTFMLKQASNNTAFFEHLLPPGPLGYFANDLSDLKDVAKRTLEAWDRYPEQLQARSTKLQRFAAALLNHVAVAEAMAHSLLTYHSKTTWKAAMEPGFTLIPFSSACHMAATSMPGAVCENIRQFKPPPRP